MSRKVTTPARSASVVTGPQGTIRVYVPGADDADGRKLARNAACAAHGGVAIGKTPSPVKAARGVTYTFTPVTTVKPAPVKAAPVKRATRKAAPVATDRIAALEAELAALRAKAAPRAKREIPAPVAARMAAVAAGKAACATCHGHGVVRKAGANAGGAYRTADGAKAATANGNAAKCPAKHARKAA